MPRRNGTTGRPSPHAPRRRERNDDDHTPRRTELQRSLQGLAQDRLPVNFGGPAGQIALMHRVLVDEKKWIDEPRFLHALNFCMLLPGPEAQQLATYIGWLLHGVRGGLAAGILFVLPGAARHAWPEPALRARARACPPIDGALFGIKAAVLVIVVEALIRIGKRALKTTTAAGDRGRGLHRHLFPRTAVPADRRGCGLDRLLRRAYSSPALLAVQKGEPARQPPRGRWRQAGIATVDRPHRCGGRRWRWPRCCSGPSTSWSASAPSSPSSPW